MLYVTTTHTIFIIFVYLFKKFHTSVTPGFPQSSSLSEDHEAKPAVLLLTVMHHPA